MTPEETNENMELNAEPIVEQIENTNTDLPVVEEVVAEPVAEVVAAPVTEVVAEPVAEVVAEPVAETVAEIAAEPVAEVVAEPVAEAVAEAVVEPVAETVAAEPVKATRKTHVAPVAPADFDWDAIGKKHEIYSSDERTKLEDAYDQTLKAIQDHEVIEGTVVTMTNREVIVNIGFKSDGVIQMNEFRYNPELKIGDKVEVYIENQEDTSGQLLLSHKKARILKSWERINDAYEKQEIIKGYVKSRTKGGLIVDIFGIEAFLPGSQIDVKPIRDYDVFVDKVMEFKVVKINHEYKNVVVSHKALIEDELEAQKAEIIKKLEKGQILEGTVKNITSYGVFVDLGGVDGLVHITDLSWGRINHPEEIVKLDQKIKVVILDFDENKKRIALGLKQLTPHPWDSLDQDLKIGDKVKGKVVVIADYGAFVEITTGVEGLIHVSEMSWSQHLRTAHDFLKVGQEVEAVILTLDREERKMSMGIKQLIPDPWANIRDKYPLRSTHTATVRNFTNFGIFVELEEGVDGLIHISDLSWSKKIKHPAEFTKIGESIEVMVLDVDVENRRLSLGHKQLEENPWDVFENVFAVGSVHLGTIVSLNDKGAIIALPYGVEGFAPLRHLGKEDNSMAKEEEAMDFKVIEFSKENKKIILSHSKIHQDAANVEKNKEVKTGLKKESDTKKAVKKLKDNLEKTTLGDIDALANLKADMVKAENLARDAKSAKDDVKPEVDTDSEEPIAE
ncbi:MAG: 30S ribosomal protein S1 [Bacteroidota bacterium]